MRLVSYNNMMAEEGGGRQALRRDFGLEYSPPMTMTTSKRQHQTEDIYIYALLILLGCTTFKLRGF